MGFGPVTSIPVNPHRKVTPMKRYFPGLAIVLAVLVLHALGFEPALAAPLVMGVTAQTTDLDELMKVVFDDVLINEVVTDTELLDQFPDGQIKTGSEGRWFELAHLVELPGAIGSRSENGYVPVPNTGRGVNGRVQLKKIMGALEETGEVLKKIRGDKAAFVNWSREQFPLFKQGLVDEIDRQLLGDSSGIRARVNDATPATTLVVNDAYGVAGFDNALMQFRKGMFLRANDTPDATSIKALVMEVQDIDWDQNAIIVDQLATGLADNDYLFEGDAADNSVGKDIMGLLGLVDDGGIVEVLQNIDRDDHLWFRSYVRDLGGGQLTERQLIRTDRQAKFRGGAVVDLILTSEAAFDEVWEAMKADRAINDPRSYTGGRSGIDILFGGTRKVTLKTCRKMPSTLVFGLQRNVFRKHVLQEWEWDDTSGSIWKQVVDSQGRKDAHYAYGTLHMEMAIKSPQKCWRLENFALDSDEESV